MAKPIDLRPAKVSPRTDLAPEVEGKLQAARAQLAALEAQVGEHVLDDAMGEPGAAARLAELNAKMEIARRDVGQLESAHRLALQRDAIAQAAIDAKARRAQLATMESHATARHAAMVELCVAIETAAKAYARFRDATDQMAINMPTGMIPHAVDWQHVDMMIGNVAFPAALAVVIRAEMYRHSVDLSRVLPGARPPTEGLRLNRGAIEPASECVRRTNEYLLGMIREKIFEMERASEARLARSA